MSHIVRDRTVSAASAPGNGNTEVGDHLKALAGEDESTYSLEDRIAAGHSLRQLLSDHPGNKDTFRRSNGFELFLGSIDSLLALFANRKLDGEASSHWVHLLRIVFSILQIALRDHKGNQRYFSGRIAKGGWEALHGKLDYLRQSAPAGEDRPSTIPEQHVLGCLFACALDDETTIELFECTDSQDGAEGSLEKADTNAETNKTTATTTERIEKILGPATQISNPEAMHVAFRLWRSWKDSSWLQGQPCNSLFIPALEYVAKSSTHNLVALHRTNLLSTILSSLSGSAAVNANETELSGLAARLLTLGITKLDDASILCTATRGTSCLSELLLPALQSARMPPYFHFDLSLYGYSSIELPDLGSAFPPTSSSNGYTLSLWFQVCTFDDSAHTTLFGAFDRSQTCFVLLYLEKDSHNLILQTSVTSSKPSVRFKSVSFREGRWYHIAIAHRRPSTSHSSRVSLYMNGNFVEQVKSNYPLASPLSPTDSKPSPARHNPVQAFLGTPQDLATRLGKGVVSCQWQLASAHLFGDVLSDDLVAVYYELGPRYYGNYQDCLGSFNTYQAAAALKIRHEKLNYGSGKEQRSDIILAMETGGSRLLPENKIILALSPSNTITSDGSASSDTTLASMFLSKGAMKSVRHMSHKGHTFLVVNGAVPSIKDALQHPHGSAVLSGDPAVVKVEAIDDASWRIGGCTAIFLDRFETSTDDNDSIRALECIFETVRDNWRCSEAMEKENGFAILAALIARKIDSAVEQTSDGSVVSPAIRQDNTDSVSKYALRVLQAVLKFLGFRQDKPEHSVLNNPLAYRVLIVDMDIWRIIKKWLDALKADTFRSTSFDRFLAAFRSMLTIHMSADHLRSLAMYITYALEKMRDDEESLGGERQEALHVQNGGSDNGRIAGQDIPDPQLSTRQVAVRVLQSYVDLICMKGDTTNVAKFSRAVTNKWLLHLLAIDDAQVVIAAMKLLARLLVVNGPDYARRFNEDTGGMSILQHRLQHWSHSPAIWRIGFAVLFGRDIALVDFEKSFNLFSLVDDFVGDGRSNTIYPDIIPVLIAMMQKGLRSARSQDSNRQGAKIDDESPSILSTVIRFLADVHSRSPEFRTFAANSIYVKELLFTLYPLVVDSSIMDADAELMRDESLGPPSDKNVSTRPSSRHSASKPSNIQQAVVQNASRLSRPELPALRRMSSYVLLKSDDQSTPAKLQSPLTFKDPLDSVNTIGQSITEELLEIIVAVYSDQILGRKEFLGLGLFMKVPPGTQEHQACFESFILRNTITHLGNAIRLDQKLLWEPRVLTNLQRFAGHLGEAVFEGWFIEGAEIVIDFLAGILEYIYHPDVYSMKSIRLCDHMIATIQEVLLRIVLLRLSEVDQSLPQTQAVVYMEKLLYWQSVLFAAANKQKHFLGLFCFLLYLRLSETDNQVREAAANLWRLLLVQKPEETSQVLLRATTNKDPMLLEGFQNLTKMDNEQFLTWVDQDRKALDGVFFSALSQPWADFVAEENRKTEETAKGRMHKRREKLRYWSSQARSGEITIHRHETSCDHWRSNIYASEIAKKQRATQDQQNNIAFNQTSWTKLKRRLERPCGLLESKLPQRWQLDQTEGRNRMRLRMILDADPHLRDYRPKRQASRGSGQHRRSTASSRQKTPSKAKPQGPSVSNTPEAKTTKSLSSAGQDASINTEDVDGDDGDEFEMVGDPRIAGDEYEDKNRKVLRSLHRNDQVEHVHNVSRIIGLEGSEGLLILGKHHLYLLDGLFQRSDGEVVNASLAPQDERDSYLLMISGREAREADILTRKREEEVRSWRRDEVLSISKRRFLFRDVAIEIFFNDGRSYLLTTNSPQSRDDLFQKLSSKTSVAIARPLSTADEGNWRFESVQSVADSSHSLGSRFTSVFAQNNANPSTRKWMQGEMSNFNYLMHVNTMAGRTFNDLTQYPVFPWVLADYSSDELDLTDPRSFRDLSKPMGCQTPERQAEFRDRYQSFAEMGDHNAPPFHYGTHYSTAMIVTSYLIRLQPFVQSYLLLQGGSFDHPDRLFYSIEKAWVSASRENMTDVRELIPEFFYLSEFLMNRNEFDFGERQGNGGTIDNVELPPWAKGDPRIFIAKNREALESEHVSKTLHHWIDLIFGGKQQGEAALEATNVFHHLSYRGARDLDKIEDPVERLATIGIIHNFGQTPYQVFQRSHPAREDGKHILKQIDIIAENLIRLPSAVFEINDRVNSLQYSTKNDRLMCTGPSKINIGPTYDKYMQWGFVDGGIRFYTSDTKKLLGLFEHVHVGQLSCVLLADSQTLVTGGHDCVISVWAVNHAVNPIELQPRGSLFGHRTAINTLAASRSFRTLLSASDDGQILLWDLNRLEIMRKLTLPGGSRVSCAKIHDVNGTLMICRGPDLGLYTLNGETLVEQNVCTEDDIIVSCAFYEGSGNVYLKRNLVFTGHRKGVVNIWNMTIRNGSFVLEHLKSMHHLDHVGYNIGAAMTCVLPLAQRVYTGDEDGRVARALTPEVRPTLQPGRLLRQDITHLRQRYISDWTIFNQLIVASAVYVFFTNLLPGITFASDLYVLTGKQWGTVEVVFSTGLCGVIFAL
ncbi:MAG: hypothetical protein LQ350_005695 [Teloschistes chrysophthalmus]|nr:MAG: hypothetical protein LQ350_005695 [Niorma chrysophthalma]